MSGLWSSEALKLRTLRGTWVAVAVGLLLAGVIGAVLGAAAPAPTLGEVALGPAQAGWLLAVVVAVLASAGEFQHHTVRTTLLATPRRGAVLVAKSGVAGCAGALLGVALAAAAVAAALLAGAVGGQVPALGGGADWAAAAGGAALCGLWAVVATGLGVLTRSTATAIATVLLWRFVGEGLLPVVTRSPGLERWTPSGAAIALVGLGGAHVLAPAPAGLLLLAYATAVCGAAALVLVRTDPA